MESTTQYRQPGWPDKHMLEAAMGLLANAKAFDDNSGWDQARTEWMYAYHRQLKREHSGPLHQIRMAGHRWAAAGGPQALATIGASLVDTGLAALAALVPGKTPPGSSAGT